jgi:hypothetical protein
MYVSYINNNGIYKLQNFNIYVAQYGAHLKQAIREHC